MCNFCVVLFNSLDGLDEVIGVSLETNVLAVGVNARYDDRAAANGIVQHDFAGFVHVRIKYSKSATGLTF